MNTDEPQPIGMEDSLRLWSLQKQKAPLSQHDQDLLSQAWRWQVWVSHGILLPDGKKKTKRSSKLSKSLQKAAAVL